MFGEINMKNFKRNIFKMIYIISLTLFIAVPILNLFGESLEEKVNKLSKNYIEEW